MSLLLCGAGGCGGSSNSEREVVVLPASGSLRTLATAYIQASIDLNRPPKNAEEIKQYLSKYGDPKDFLKSPVDGADYVVHWGADVEKLRGPANESPIWVYEKNPHDGKRWVLQYRFARELTENEFRSAPFAPGFKKPF